MSPGGCLPVVGGVAAASEEEEAAVATRYLGSAALCAFPREAAAPVASAVGVSAGRTDVGRQQRPSGAAACSRLRSLPR